LTSIGASPSPTAHSSPSARSTVPTAAAIRVRCLGVNDAATSAEEAAGHMK
jgi:hypothetical protein